MAPEVALCVITLSERRRLGAATATRIFDVVQTTPAILVSDVHAGASFMAKLTCRLIDPTVLVSDLEAAMELTEDCLSNISPSSGNIARLNLGLTAVQGLLQVSLCFLRQACSNAASTTGPLVVLDGVAVIPPK